MPIINEYDALTDENAEITVTAKDVKDRFGADEVKSFAQIVEEQVAAKNIARTKLAALGLLEEDLIALGL